MIVFRTVKIPHLNYEVRMRPIGKIPADCPVNTCAYAERNDRWSCTIFLSKKATPPMVAHEVVHVIQFLFADRGIDFSEQEHAGYLMQYLLGEILGYRWEPSK